ncbi:hypothetical protein CDEN61S_03848 [Castellaniella denitrificans]|uniref:DUF2946 domain-containing protein n=1 Tax=Castellaniella sp. TaxID=1955812 RepID=UPI002B0024CA|nr:DUF2946 domain-containing protein [Castellaniella sp.]
MSYGPRKRSTRLAAWFGLLAMCLLIAAPTISWLVEAPSRDVAVSVCFPADSANQPAADYRIRVGGHHDGPADGMDACGYCGLLAHDATLPATPPAAPAVLLLALFLLAAPRWIRHVPLGTFPAGRPRDPPRFS